MQIRHILMIGTTTILTLAVGFGLYMATSSQANTSPTITQLANVRDFVHALNPTEQSFVVDGGKLFADEHGAWIQLNAPAGIIVSAVAVDTSEQNALYIGAANAMAIFRSTDAGQTWLRVPLTREFIGGVTDIAIDHSQRLVYVGTDTAGVFRLRDVGSSMILSGQVLINEPVRQIAVDSGGSGLVLARTDWNLYRAENYGVTWFTVDTLGSSPTALALAPASSPSLPPPAFVGTVDRGLVTSLDRGATWSPANEGLGLVPGSRLTVDALSIDPAAPSVLYVSTSYLFGSTTLHKTPVEVAISVDTARTWKTLVGDLDTAVVDLIPVPGMTGAAYAFTAASRTPLTIGDAPSLIATNTGDLPEVTPSPPTDSARLAWIVASLAALALTYSVFLDLRYRRRAASSGDSKHQTQPVSSASQ